MKSNPRNSLTGKMSLRFLKGLAAGVFVIVILYFSTSQMLLPRLVTSDHVKELEQQKVNLFQEYISQNDVNVADYQKLKNWTTENDIDQLVVFRGDWLLFDSEYENIVSEGAKKISLQFIQSNYEVYFADGNANVYVDLGGKDRYEQILMIVSILSGLAVCLLIFISGIHEDIVYIKKMEEQVSRIRGGDLQTEVTVSGKDELANLAHGLDEMRESLLKKEQTEAEMKAAQNKLVLGMSHDLRTPLTGLITYLEILRQQKKNENFPDEFVEKSMEKALQIRQMSDDLFEYFQLTSKPEVKLEDAEQAFSVFGDYISEMCSWLKHSGFHVHMNMPEHNAVCVRVNIDFIGRIVNNVLSNMEKYADREKVVELGMIYTEDSVIIYIQNAVSWSRKQLKGTGMGMKNIAFMMEQMMGNIHVSDTEEYYRIELEFPVYSDNRE